MRFMSSTDGARGEEFIRLGAEAHDALHTLIICWYTRHGHHPADIDDRRAASRGIAQDRAGLRGHAQQAPPGPDRCPNFGQPPCSAHRRSNPRRPRSLGRRGRITTKLQFLYRAPAIQAGRAVQPVRGEPADPRPASPVPQGWEHWFLCVTRKAIKADYLVHHDTLSAARSNRTHLVHDTCHRSRNQPRTARNTVMQQTN